MNHEILRHIADTWGLLALLVIFLAAIGFALRPSARAYYKECGRIPIDDDDLEKIHRGKTQ